MDFVNTGITALGIGVAVLFVALQMAASRTLKDTLAKRTRVAIFSAVGAGAWLSLWYWVADAGAFEDFEARPPRVLLILVATGSMGIVLGLSKIADRLIAAIPIGVLIGVQGFRVPLEYVMHRAALEKIMPNQMSWSGYNFDVVTGALALLVGLLALFNKAPRALMWAWLVLSFITLFTVVGIAVASTPLFHAFGTDPDVVNTWIATAPAVWLPTVMVAFALGGQVTIARRLRTL